jgi:hypothetical protein
MTDDEKRHRHRQHVIDLFRHDREHDGPVTVTNEGPSVEEVEAARQARRSLRDRLRDRLRGPAG